MEVVIEWEQWALTLVTYPLLSAADLAAVLLLYFSPRTEAHATGSSTPFDAGTSTFLRFHHAFLVLFSLVAVVEGIHLVFGEDELVSGVGLVGIRWLHTLLPPRLLRSSSVDFLASSLIK